MQNLSFLKSTELNKRLYVMALYPLSSLAT